MPGSIHIASDLHLNFHPVTLPGGEILILAGDIMEAGHIKRYHRHALHQAEHFNYVRFCQEELVKYDRVLYVFGNHEYWGSSMEEARTWIETLLPPHVTILDGTTTQHQDIQIWGGTLWTDQSDPIKAWDSKRGMNDYSKIKTTVPIHGHWTSKLTPHHTHQIHRSQLRQLQTWLAETQQPKLVVTHHSPVPDQHQGHLGHCYYTDLRSTIYDQGPDWWIWGHTHEAVNEHLANTQLISNPRGYYGYEPQANNWKPFELNI